MPFVLNAVVVLTGSGTYTPPVGVTALWIRMVGGGGAGGGSSSGIAVEAVGSGGGGPSYVEKFLTPLAASYAYSVGAGGTGVAAGAGNPGGDTTFGSLSALGGPGGRFSSANTSYVAGVAGAAVGTGGDINTTGSYGMACLRNSSAVALSGRGGRSHFAGGGQIIYSNGSSNQDGNPGGFPGGAGSGGKSRNSSATGGAGAAGTIIIFEYEDSGPPPPVPSVPSNPSVMAGVITTLVQNIAYAIPARIVVIYYQGTQPQQSNDGISWTNITNGTFLAGGFIRSTGTDTIIKLDTKGM